MPDELKSRNEVDRRRKPRGGRRPEDVDGLTPLVLLVGQDRQIVEGSEAILAKLKFAVARSANVDEALRVLDDLRPELIVVSGGDAEALRAAARVPVLLALPAPDDSPERLADRVLQAFRSRPVF